MFPTCTVPCVRYIRVYCRQSERKRSYDRVQKRTSNRRQRFGELKRQHARVVWGGCGGGGVGGCYTVDIPVPYCLHRRIISALTDGVIGTFDVPRRTKLHRSMTASGAPCDGSDRNRGTDETYEQGTYQCHNSAHAS